MKTFALRALAHLTVALAATTAGAAWAADAVNLYTTREPALIQPLLDAFTKAHNGAIQVNTVVIKDGMLERVKAEGARSPADVLMTVDIPVGNTLPDMAGTMLLCLIAHKLVPDKTKAA